MSKQDKPLTSRRVLILPDEKKTENVYEYAGKILTPVAGRPTKYLPTGLVIQVGENCGDIIVGMHVAYKVANTGQEVMDGNRLALILDYDEIEYYLNSK